MFTAIDRLRTLRVRDVMAHDVVTVDAGLTMSQAAAQLAEHDMSSAPVVDEAGCVVGVLSAADFIQRDRPHGQEQLANLVSQAKANATGTPSSESGDDTARSYMTPTVRSVGEDASLLEAARVMCDCHIHHLPVVEPGNRAIGMVSTMDIVASVVNAVDEMDQDRPLDF